MLFYYSQIQLSPEQKKMFEKYTQMQKSLYLMIYLEVTIFKEHRMT